MLGYPQFDRHILRIRPVKFNQTVPGIEWYALFPPLSGLRLEGGALLG
jgi:hypothetical protein